jgi:MFS family permease
MCVAWPNWPGKSPLASKDSMLDLRNYVVITAAYWGFTLTDGALRMLVLLHFHTLGYTPLELSFLFLLYEFFGVVTNLLAGWIGSRFGLKLTLYCGLGLQVEALYMLSTLAPDWEKAVAVTFVVAAQGLSGIAKDLTKMSSKSAIKLVVPDDELSALFNWVALLTGSKNALKGAGFFLGATLLSGLGFVHALWAMAAGLFVILIAAVVLLPADLGKAKAKVKFTKILSKSLAINLLSTARFFLFGARDVWFVVGVPLFLYEVIGWSFPGVGAFMASWVIGLWLRSGIGTPYRAPFNRRPLQRNPGSTMVDVRPRRPTDRHRWLGRSECRTDGHGHRRLGVVRNRFRYQFLHTFLFDPILFGFRKSRA